MNARDCREASSTKKTRNILSQNPMVERSVKFSLVLATVGRSEEVSRLLGSLTLQTYSRFDVVVVDQNSDGRLMPILDRYSDRLSIIRVHSEGPLSRARNRGLQEVRGTVIGFPDDDGWYPPDLLQRLALFFSDPSNDEWDGVAGKAVDKAGDPLWRFDRRAGRISKYNVWRRATAHSIFLRAEAVRVVGTFDETLGLPHSSGEDIDYILQLIGMGCEVLYLPSILVYHPRYEPGKDREGSYTERTYRYMKGMGLVLRKHAFPLSFLMYWQARSLVGMAVSLVRGRMTDATRHLAALKGRLAGWFDSAG